MKLLDTSTHAQHTTRGLFEAVLANAGAESTRRPDTVSLRLSLGEEGATRFRPIASLPHTSLISPLCDVRTESRLPPAYLPPLRRRCLSRTRAGVASSSTGEIYPSSYPSADWANQFAGLSVGQAAVRQGLHGAAPSPRMYGELIARRGGPTSPRGSPLRSAAVA